MIQTTKTLQSNHIFFDPEIILIFGGIFLHSLYRLIKFKLNWIRVSKTDSARKNVEPGGRIQIQIILVERQVRSNPKAPPKIDPFILKNCKRQYVLHTLFKIGILRTSYI